jgi:hypothetical protein
VTDHVLQLNENINSHSSVYFFPQEEKDLDETSIFFVILYRMHHLKDNPKTITCLGTEMKSEAGPPPCNRLYQPSP